MYKIDLTSLYPAFVESRTFLNSVENIPDKTIRAAVLKEGIGDNLDRDSCGNIFYDFESGNLLEAEVQDALNLLSEEDYRENFRAIGFLAEAYAEWANNLEKKLNRVSELESQMETLSAIDKSAKEYQEALRLYAQTMGYTLA